MITVSMLCTIAQEFLCFVARDVDESLTTSTTFHLQFARVEISLAIYDVDSVDDKRTDILNVFYVSIRKWETGIKIGEHK